MSETIPVIRKILEEIGDSDQTGGLPDSGIKSAQQVVGILLDRRPEDGPGGAVSSSGYDLDDLSRWKERVNQLYQVHYYRVIHSHRKVLGPVIIFFKKVIRKILKFLFEPMLEEQNEFNGAATASINALYNAVVVSQDMRDRLMEQKETLAGLEDRLREEKEQLEQRMEQFEQSRERFERRMEQFEQKKSAEADAQRAFTERWGAERDRIDRKIEEAVKNMAQYISENQQEIEALESKVDEGKIHFARMFQNHRQPLPFDKDDLPAESPKAPEKVEDAYSAIDYFDFENRFRGSERDIKKAQKGYLKYFENKKHVLDIGCGRGEFLELLRENGIGATGVDSYEEYVNYCLLNGLNVVHGNAVVYLRGLPDNSLDGLFAAQLIEHLPTEQLVALCREACEKLQPGSYLIMETPNPTCLSTFTNGFYMDPSHIKPVHPKTLQYLLEKAGFQKTELVFTEQSKIPYRLPLLDGENVRNLSNFNDGVNLLSDVLFGSQDYAVIAQK